MRDRSGGVLLVEDNPDDEEFTLMALNEAGVTHDIHVARDGAEALDYLFGSEGDDAPASRPLPALILLDLMLPKVSGFQVLERIRASERTKLIPVVILTSSDADEDVVRGYRLGVNSYVRKPVESSAFAEAVRQLGVYWLVLNEPGSREGGE